MEYILYCDDNALFQGGVYSLQSWIDGDDFVFDYIKQNRTGNMMLKRYDLLKERFMNWGFAWQMMNL